MSTAARQKLMAFDWPGNVRQLRNTIESMVVVDFDGVLDVDDLPAELAGQTADRAAEQPPAPSRASSASRWSTSSGYSSARRSN